MNQNNQKPAAKQKMNRNTIPEGFTVPMALVDLLPVLFFGGTGLLLGLIAGNVFVEICAVAVCLSGLLKVIWKMIAAVQKKNIWPLFVQMRIAMPVGFLGMVVGCIWSLCHADTGAVLRGILGMPQVVLFSLGILGMCGMIFCAAKLDSADPKANWLEQVINSFAQGCIFLGMLLAWLS